MTPGDDNKPDEDVEEGESSASSGEEPSEGSIAASEELEAALREATESVEAREAEGVPTGDLSEEVLGQWVITLPVTFVGIWRAMRPCPTNAWRFACTSCAHSSKTRWRPFH